jgi:hypothetical protein
MQGYFAAIPPHLLLTESCCMDSEHVLNKILHSFKSALISGLDRTKKNIKVLVEKGGFSS